MTFKRIISILMIGILLISFTGCKTGDSESALADEFIESEQTGEEIFGEKEEEEPEKEKEDPAPEEKEEEPEEQPKEEVKPEQKPADPAPEKEEEPEAEEPKEPEQEPEKEPEPEVKQQPEADEESTEQKGSLYTAEENPYKDSLKILAIGNSFSNDGMRHLWDIANSMGVKEVVVANMYIAGCSLDTHYKNMAGNAPAYRYYKNTSGTWRTKENVALSTALKDEEWDIITLQQVSEDNSKADSYKNLQGILQYVQQRKPKKETKLLWHMTWAYQADSNRQALMDYGNNQIKMYEGVLDRIRNDVLIYDDFDGVIPVGTTIQNLRTTSVGDTLTRDGYHLSEGFGRFAAALTWYCYITGADPAEVPFTPAIETNKILMHFDNICKSVSEAIQNPYEIMK